MVYTGAFNSFVFVSAIAGKSQQMHLGLTGVIMITSNEKLWVALRSSSEPVEITKEIYWNFLEILPPRDMGHNYFIFQEGSDGDVYRFTEIGDSYYCEMTSGTLVTTDWQLHVRVQRVDNSVKVASVISYCGASALGKAQGFMGRIFETIDQMAQEMQLEFRV